MSSYDTAVAISPALAGRSWLADTKTRESRLRVFLSLRRLLKRLDRVSQTRRPVTASGAAFERGPDQKSLNWLSLRVTSNSTANTQSFESSPISGRHDSPVDVSAEVLKYARSADVYSRYY